MKICSQTEDERGIAVIIVLALVSLMLAFVLANGSALFQLKREIKLTDQRQRERWAKMQSAETNSAAAEKSTK
jgi:hypothetical protein